MRNYISVNAKYYKAKELGRIIEHNFRIEKPDYLLSEESIKGENLDMIFNKDGLKTQNYKLLKEAKAEHLYNVFHDFKDARDEVYKKKKYYGNPNSNDIIEMVVAVSEEQALNYLKKGESMMDGLENFAQTMKREYGLEPMAISLHLDEGFEQNEIKNNIHAHVVFFNFDFEQERSRWRNITRADTSRFQDLAQKSFQEKGYNFVRGESKEISGKKHLERNDFILSKQKQQLESYDLILKNLIPHVNEEKKDLKALLNTFNKNSVEYKLVYNLVGSTTKLEKELRKYAKVEDFGKENEKELKLLLKNHLDKAKDFYKLNFDKTKPLVDDLNNFLNKISKVDLEFTNTKEKDKKIAELEEQLKVKEEQNNTLLEKLNEERNKNKVLQQDKGQIAAQNQKLIQVMDKQQKALIRQTRRNQRLRNQRNRLLQKVMRDNNLKSVMQTRNFLRNSKNRVLNKKQVPEEQHDFKSL